MILDRRRRVQDCKFAYFVSGAIFAIIGFWWYSSVKALSWYWGDTLLALAGVSAACYIMIAASKQLDEYLEEMQQHH